MGEARRRGTYEQRKAEGEAKRLAEKQQRDEAAYQARLAEQKERHDRLKAMTDEEREQHFEEERAQRKSNAVARVLMASVIGTALARGGNWV